MTGFEIQIRDIRNSAERALQHFIWSIDAAKYSSGNTTVEEPGGDQMELPIKESMSQKQKLQFLQPRGSEAKKVILSQLITYGNLQTHSS